MFPQERFTGECGRMTAIKKNYPRRVDAEGIRIEVTMDPVAIGEGKAAASAPVRD